ncbi:MAG: YccS family putative transporter [Neisseria sp.]|nr:YccS family putative transporter [Neisseria sp.]
MKFKTPPVNPKIIATAPAFVSVIIAAVAIRFWHLESITIPLILGIIAGGLADLDNRLTGRLKNLFFTFTAFAIAILAVQFSLPQPVLLTLTLTVLAFVFTIIGAVGLRYRTIAFAAVAVSVYTALTYRDDGNQWFINPSMILLGAALYSSLTLLLHILFPHRPVQESVANAYQSLSEYLDEKAGFFNPDESEHLGEQQIALAMKNQQVIAQFNQCRSALFYRMSGQHRHPRTSRMLRFYFVAQDIHERASSSHLHYQDLAEKLKNSDLIFRFLRLLELQAQACRELAQCLRDGQSFVPSARLNRAEKGLRQSIAHYVKTHPNDEQIHSLQRLASNLQSVNHQLTHLESGQLDEEGNPKQLRIAHQESSGWRDAFKNIRANLTLASPTFRHATRMALLALVCVAIVQIFQIEFGYWILLTAVFVCQPNYSATQTRLKQRVIGTLAGVLVGSLLPYFTPSLETKLAVLILATTLFFFFRANKYSYSTFFITIQAIISFSIAGYESLSALPMRMLDTVIGSGLAWAAVSFLWPDWHYLQLNQTGAKAVASNANYLRSVLQQLHDGKGEHVDYRLSRRQSHEKAAALSSTLSDMSGEPEKYGNRLEDGFKLLKINYSLISYISALGAFRDQMQHEEDNVFEQGFYEQAENLCLLLEQLCSLNAAEFAERYQNLHAAIAALQPESQDEQSQILWQQLHLIERLLEPAYLALHGEENAMPSAV